MMAIVEQGPKSHHSSSNDHPSEEISERIEELRAEDCSRNHDQPIEQQKAQTFCIIGFGKLMKKLRIDTFEPVFGICCGRFHKLKVRTKAIYLPNIGRTW